MQGICSITVKQTLTAVQPDQTDVPFREDELSVTLILGYLTWRL